MDNSLSSVEPKHCEDYIGDKTQPKCLRLFLLYHRVPAYQRMKWDERGWNIPVLFASRPASRGPGGGYRKSTRVRVTMASRFGDVGITNSLEQTHGYHERVSVEDLTDFSTEA